MRAPRRLDGWTVRGAALALLFLPVDPSNRLTAQDPPRISEAESVLSALIESYGVSGAEGPVREAVKHLDKSPEPIAQLLGFIYSLSRQGLTDIVRAAPDAASEHARTTPPEIGGARPIPARYVFVNLRNGGKNTRRQHLFRFLDRFRSPIHAVEGNRKARDDAWVRLKAILAKL